MKGAVLIAACGALAFVAVASFASGAAHEYGRAWMQDTLAQSPARSDMTMTYVELITTGSMSKPRPKQFYDRILPEGWRPGAV